MASNVRTEEHEIEPFPRPLQARLLREQVSVYSSVLTAVCAGVNPQVMGAKSDDSVAELNTASASTVPLPSAAEQPEMHLSVAEIEELQSWCVCCAGPRPGAGVFRSEIKAGDHAWAGRRTMSRASARQ